MGRQQPVLEYFHPDTRLYHLCALSWRLTYSFGEGRQTATGKVTGLNPSLRCISGPGPRLGSSKRAWVWPWMREASLQESRQGTCRTLRIKKCRNGWSSRSQRRLVSGQDFRVSSLFLVIFLPALLSLFTVNTCNLCTREKRSHFPRGHKPCCCASVLTRPSSCAHSFQFYGQERRLRAEGTCPGPVEAERGLAVDAASWWPSEHAGQS